MKALFCPKRRLLKRNRLDEAPSFSLIEEVTQTIKERLSYVKKGFQSPFLVGPLGRQLLGFPEAFAIYDPEQLCFKGDSFDLMASVFDISFMNDVPGFLAQSYECLKPGGLLMGAAFGPKTFQELRTYLYQVEEKLTKKAHLRFDPLIAPGVFVELFTRKISWALPVVDTQEIKLSFSSFSDFLHHQRCLGLTHHLFDVHPFSKKLYEETKSFFPAVLTVEVIYFSAWKKEDRSVLTCEKSNLATRALTS